MRDQKNDDKKRKKEQEKKWKIEVRMEKKSQREEEKKSKVTNWGSEPRNPGRADLTNPPPSP